MFDLYVYSGLLAIGGAIGYLKAGSTVSLGMGLLSSGLVYVGIIFKKKGNSVPLAVKGFRVITLDYIRAFAIDHG
jgi:uncharacterized membrane protein (UPF0136 family)